MLYKVYEIKKTDKHTTLLFIGMASALTPVSAISDLMCSCDTARYKAIAVNTQGTEVQNEFDIELDYNVDYWYSVERLLKGI